MNDTLQILIGLIAIIGAISTFLIWHFSTLHKLKDQIHGLKLQLKDLEKKDELQQQTIDQLKDLYPLFQKVIESLNLNHKKK